MSNLPCLLIGFAREQGILNCLDKSIAAGINKFYVSLDGPTNRTVAEIQEKIIAELERVAKFEEIEILVQILDENLGSGAAVISAINWFMSHEKAGIILEDDLEIDNDFFKFVTESLCFHYDNTQVLSVSGFNPHRPASTSMKGFKVRYPVSWGWSTTREKWAMIQNLLFNPIPRRSWRLPVLSSYWHTGKARALTGRIDAWDIPLAASMRFSNKFTVLPPINLVTNVGSDNHAAHTRKLEWPLGEPRLTLPKNWNPEELSGLADITDYFESSIYRIRFRNILSLPASWFLDSVRFKGRREPIQRRIDSHSSRKIVLG